MSESITARGRLAPRKLVYCAMSKHTFYYRLAISHFVAVEEDACPVNPFMNFDYYLMNAPRDFVRECNQVLQDACEEVWVFGPISDGVQHEIERADANKQKLRFFEIEGIEIKEIVFPQVTYEAGVNYTDHLG